MSFFYLSPVLGRIPLHLLEDCVQRRVEHLTRILSGIQSEYCEYVIEGSVYDNVGHYMLQLVSILSENEAFSQFCTRGETELFRKRLCSSSHYEFHRFVRKLYRQLRKLINMEPYLYGLFYLCQKLGDKLTSQHLKSNGHSLECRMHFFESDFKLCLSFVAKRMVEIRNGMASIPCGYWLVHMTDIFKYNLKLRQKLAIKCKVLEYDPRVKCLVRKIVFNDSRIINNPPQNEITGLKASNVDKYVILFPLCMKLLHNVLRKKHRLSHEQRFRYGLFLKEIGMPIEEAILFWKDEYLKPADKTSLCCHSWYTDEKNYIYSIRHLYGLEGARKKYCMASCSRIQGNNDISTSEGGCPFKNFDMNILSDLLDPCVKMNSDNFGHILNLGKKNFPNTTCRLYFKYLSKSKSKGTSTSSDFILTPLNYYNKLKESLEW